jgi:hypothetical protein
MPQMQARRTGAQCTLAMKKRTFLHQILPLIVWSAVLETVLGWQDKVGTGFEKYKCNSFLSSFFNIGVNSKTEKIVVTFFIDLTISYKIFQHTVNSVISFELQTLEASQCSTGNKPLIANWA